ncbi:alpha/beta fold hydrolase [Embleya scabrispora]|uniref:alpha/beta fold hydrolase n=1 Tax=Embleya scabrispora TaxID=159449 RepID=UPI00037E77CF|nr:alpha/beta hydrolase [Embleya scabrispora]MYS85360.1 alpha/beta fold hydrolase [Streptomyces sp. SID5474]
MKSPRSRRKLALGAAAFTLAGAAAFATLPPAAAAADGDRHGPRPPKPTIVLVHGGFADASNWNGVISRLHKDGYPVIAPANPLRGIPTDATYIASVLTSIQGPIVLVGHSYGGAVITNAAAGNPNVKALVYVAAFVPDTGEKLGDIINRYPGSEIQAATRQVPFTNPDGTTGTDLYIRADRLRDVFAADLSKKETQLMAAEQRPFSASAFGDATTAAAWRTIPSYGVVAGADKAIPAAVERWEYQRAGARRVVEVRDASHVVMISHPDVVERLIEQAATDTR